MKKRASEGHVGDVQERHPLPRSKSIAVNRVPTRAGSDAVSVDEARQQPDHRQDRSYLFFKHVEKIFFSCYQLRKREARHTLTIIPYKFNQFKQSLPLSVDKRETKL